MKMQTEWTSCAFHPPNLAPDVMALSGDRDFLACGARDGSINLFALRIRRHIHSFRVHAAVSALSWDACAGDERTVFIGMKDCSVEGFTFNLNGKVSIKICSFLLRFLFTYMRRLSTFWFYPHPPGMQ
jgi:WD40 repeat protein